MEKLKNQDRVMETKRRGINNGIQGKNRKDKEFTKMRQT